MPRLTCILVSLYGICFFPLWGQVSTNFRHYSVRDGLAQNTVFTICQDSAGFIWLGTRYGLNKFDGYQFKTFHNDKNDETTLSNNDIRALSYNKEDKIMWVGTMNGLNAYHERTNSFTRYLPVEGNNTSLSHHQVNTMYLDSDQNLWIGTLDGLNLFDRKNQQFKRINEGGEKGLSHPNIKRIFEDSQRNLWVGTEIGLNKLIKVEGENYEFEQYFHIPGDENSLSQNEIKAISEDKLGNLWIGTRSGLNRFIAANKTFKRYYYDENDPNSLTNSNIGGICVDSMGQVWVGTIRGLNLYQPETDNFQSFFNRGESESGLSNNSIIFLFADREGSVWIGTFRGGVNFWNQFINQFPYYQYNAYTNSINESAINSFGEDKKGNLWIGTNGGGLNYYNINSGKFSVFEKESKPFGMFLGKQIKIIEGDDNRLWLGTFNHGLFQINTRTSSVKTYQYDPDRNNSLSNNDVYALARKDQYLFIGTYGGGLNRLDLETDKIDHFIHNESDSQSLCSDFIRKLYRDSENKLWIGTESGLNLLEEKNGEIHFKRVGDPLNIYSLYEDSRKILWAGTYGDGLVGLDQTTGKWLSYTMDEGLPGNIIFGILEDDEKNLWLSTNGGLSHVNYRTSTIINYNPSDGLRDQEFFYNAYYKTRTGELLFGGANGFTRFHPRDVLRNTYKSSIVFTDLKVLGQTVEVNDDTGLLSKPLNEVEELVFSYNQAVFSVSFSSLNLVSPEKNKYTYRLKGLEEEWNYATGTSSATYAIQDHGDYVLEVKGANSDGIWNPVSENLKIRVLPAPWRSWWAFCIYTALLVIALILLIKFTQIRTSLYHKIELEQLEKHKQEELHQMKLRFFTNITHEFRTPLTLILSPMEMLQERYESDFYLKKQLKTIQRSTQRLLNLVNQLLTFSKLESEHFRLNLKEGEFVGFLREIFETFQSYAEQRNFTYTIDVNTNELYARFDADKLGKVFYNLLSNAFKFTGDNGIIHVSLVQVNKKVSVQISDNGRGVKTKDIDKIFQRFYEGEQGTVPSLKSTGIGLAVSRELVQLHQGDIHVESEWGKGTTFTVSLPIEHTSPPPINQEAEQELTFLSSNLIDEHFLSSTLEKVPPLKLKAPQVNEETPLVLIIEDNAEIRQYIFDLFSEIYRLEVAKDAYEGFELARETLPNLIISDVMMPGMDGIQMCGKLKQDLHTSHIPILLLTARTSDLSRIEGFEVGADDYISKPFHPKELRVRVRNLIESRKRLREQFVKIVNLEPKEITLTSADEQFLSRAMEIIEANIDNSQFTMEDFADELAVSRALLFNKLKALTEQTPNKFMQTIRLKRAAQLLLQAKKFTVSEIAYKVGFKDPKYFSKCFQKQYEMTPSNYARRSN